jgi:hypothetical protein
MFREYRCESGVTRRKAVLRVLLAQLLPDPLQATLRLKESVKERRCFLGNADDLIRGLTIEFEIDFGLGPAVGPMGKVFYFAAPQWLLRKRGASDSDAHPRCLPGHASEWPAACQ